VSRPISFRPHEERKPCSNLLWAVRASLREADHLLGTAPAIKRMFAGVAPLQSAGQDEVSLLDNRRYAAAPERTMAGAVIVHQQMLARVPSSATAIVTASAYEGWARVAALFHPVPPPCPGIHPSAAVHPDARVDASAEIGPYAVVEAGAEVGPDCRIGSFVLIGAGVSVGRDCRVAPMPASVTRCLARAHIPGRPDWSGGL
jgi:UDP-3-O-[3-hydroxymyristoyl] glucosamine N-acyltransferase